MSYAHVSVPKSGYNPGRVMAKDPNIVLFRWDDVASVPVRDANGVLIAGDLTLESDANGIKIYATPTTIKVTEETVGDPDKKGFIHNLEFEHPGDELAYEEWAENNVNTNLGAIVKQLDTGEMKLLGTQGSPLQFTAELQDTNEHVTNIIKLSSLLPSPKIARYEGVLPDFDSASGA